MDAKFVVGGGMNTPEEKCMGVFGMSIDSLVEAILINANKEYDGLYVNKEKPSVAAGG